MSAVPIRIFSDLHFGDPASRIHRLAQLRPLFDGVGHVVLNGDTLDTRPGPRPAHTAACRAQVESLGREHPGTVTFLTGNHDPDVSPHHSLDLADGRIFVTHGDVLFDKIVPWSRDASLISERIAAEIGPLSASARAQLDNRFAIWRRVAASIPQRHQSEPRGWKHAASFIADTVWPPLRILRVLQAWHHEPRLAAALARRHRPHAKFILLGHTHRPAVRAVAGFTVINTGSFGPPFGAFVVDLLPGRLVVRRVVERAGEFHPDATVVEFPLA